ncbi:MAG: BamA/TamA family outer membrane protein [Candidatus Bipolaricaulota bacterium]|nr:BamA/TamA family outer membrane protein [Candidatus Bipolaricaulota bacterium]
MSIQDDSTNNPSFPVRGTRRSIALEKAGGFAVGREYTKLDMTWTRFLPLYDELFSAMDHTLAIRLKMGFGDQGLGGAEAYELGGPMTIRGVEGTSVTRMLVANMEYRVKLTDGLTIAAFLDAGADLNRIYLSDAPASAGFELGITAAGMFVRLDVAWVLGADASWIPRFDFGFGPMF